MRSSRRRTRLDDFSTHALHARIFSVRAPSGACVCVRLRLRPSASASVCVCVRASASASVRLRLHPRFCVRASASVSVHLRLRPCFCVSIRQSVCPSVRLQVGPCGPCVCGSGTNTGIYNYVTVHAIGKKLISRYT